MRSGVDRCDPQKMKQRSKSQEAPMVISPRDVARLLKQLSAGPTERTKHKAARDQVEKS